MVDVSAQRWAVITSDHVRHRFFANVLSEHPLVTAVVIEPKTRNPARNFSKVEDENTLRDYFAERGACERELLREGSEWRLARNQALLPVAKGGINDAKLVARLVDMGVTHCIVFGASWLKTPWLQAFPLRLINLHLGLSPYFRGSGTNFWPIHEGLPEYVGATIHMLDAGLDSGEILLQVRPAPAADDTIHSLGNKTIRKATMAIRTHLEMLTEIEGVPQWSVPNKRFFRSADFDAHSLREAQALLDKGMMADYLADLARRACAVRVVNEYDPIWGA